MANAPRVFISYAHEGDLSQQVKLLAEFLLGKGIEVITDHPYENRAPKEGWTAWMQHSIERADFVLMVCTSRYKRIFEKREILEKGGKGATWEAALITQDIYDQYLLNTKFYPILPDGGDAENIPIIFRQWDNWHRFPSGYDRIYKLITEEVRIPTPTQPFTPYLFGEIQGPNDVRLQCANADKLDGKILGRNSEINAVVTFLESHQSGASVCGHVKGSGGIGKTEICKAALKQWLASSPQERAFWIDVSDEADTQQLLGKLAEAIDVRPENLSSVTDLNSLKPYLRDGLYYLDNLESLAEADGGMQLLKAFSKLPGKRILASSRVDLSHVLGEGITVDKLDTVDALQLFMRLWEGKDTPPVTELNPFLVHELGNHPLSITLMANLGNYYSWPTLLKKWQEQGTALAEVRTAVDRLDSLQISLALTAAQIQSEPGANDLWQFAALFPEGLSEGMLDLWEDISQQDNARRALVDHHILNRSEDGMFQLLPPMARYALAQQQNKGFSWPSARQYAYDYFLSLSRAGANTVTSEEGANSKVSTAAQMWSIVTLVKYDQRREPDLDRLELLHRQLLNIYKYNVLASQQLLNIVREMIVNGEVDQIAGDIEARLGNIYQARILYDKAIKYFEKYKDNLGLANSLKALGDLKQSSDDINLAPIYYKKAIKLYEIEQNQLGLANTYKALGELNYLLDIPGTLDLYADAIRLYRSEQDSLGLADTLRALGDLECELEKEKMSDARDHYNEAMIHYEKEQYRLGQGQVHLRLGELERALDNLPDARYRYDLAIDLFQKEEDQLGLANTFRSYGNSYLNENQWKDARDCYDKAKELYRLAQDPMGLAYTLAESIRCIKNMNYNDKQQLCPIAREALIAARQSGIESVVNYVTNALVEYFEGDNAAFEAFIKSLFEQ